jgi:hypothetical protein
MSVILSVLLMVFIVVNGLIDTTYSRNHNDGIAALHRKQGSPSQTPQGFTGVGVYGTITSFDTVDLRLSCLNLSFKMHFGCLPFGNLVDPEDELGRSPATMLLLTIDSQTLTYPSKQDMASHVHLS